MSTHSVPFPHLDAPILLTDGGLETTLVFHEGLDLPSFAAFVLLDRPEGPAVLERYYRTYAELAHAHGAGLLLGTPTWRANRDWGLGLGYDDAALADLNRRAVELLVGLRATLPADQPPLAIGGMIGPRADGYVPGKRMTAAEAEDYHGAQVETFASGKADFLTVETLNYAEEGAGLARAARSAEIPVVISFTVETDGRLPTGQPLAEAIGATDEASDAYPAYYMINCAHPTHFEAELRGRDPRLERLGGLRVNASCRSHAELNASDELDEGNPLELAGQLSALADRLPGLRVFGGCCGTDDRHIAQIAKALRHRAKV